MIVKDVMKKSVISVEPEMSVTDAKDLMNKKNISKLPVISKGKLVGIITKNDLMQAGPSMATTLDMYEISYLLSKLTVKKIMCNKVITVSPDEVVEEAARIMVENQIGCLPVVKGGACIGIITESDLFHLFTDMFGALDKGIRVVLVMKDIPGQLASICEKVAECGGNIVSLVTAEMSDKKNRMVTIKMTGLTLPKAKKMLKEIDGEVEDIRVL